jgi:hypothetical protein
MTISKLFEALEKLPGNTEVLLESRVGGMGISYHAVQGVSPLGVMHVNTFTQDHKTYGGSFMSNVMLFPGSDDAHHVAAVVLSDSERVIVF